MQRRGRAGSDEMSPNDGRAGTAGVVGRRLTEGRDPASKIWPLREAWSSNDSRRTVEEERLRHRASRPSRESGREAPRFHAFGSANFERARNGL